MFTKLTSFWSNLPKEVKVSCYIVFSVALSEAIKLMSGLNLDSLVLSGLINVALVALAELKKRVDLTR